MFSEIYCLLQIWKLRLGLGCIGLGLGLVGYWGPVYAGIVWTSTVPWLSFSTFGQTCISVLFVKTIVLKIQRDWRLWNPRHRERSRLEIIVVSINHQWQSHCYQQRVEGWYKKRWQEFGSAAGGWFPPPRFAFGRCRLSREGYSPYVPGRVWCMSGRTFGRISPVLTLAYFITATFCFFWLCTVSEYKYSLICSTFTGTLSQLYFILFIHLSSHFIFQFLHVVLMEYACLLTKRVFAVFHCN